MISPITVKGLFVGQVALLAGDSRSSAIVKMPVTGRCLLTRDGLAGDTPADAVTLAEFWRVIRAPKPSIESLLRLAHASGLDPAWTGKLTQRAEWLRNNPAVRAP